MVKIIKATGYLSDKDKRKIKEAGLEGFLGKSN